MAESENWADIDANAAAVECPTVPFVSDADNPLCSSIRDEAALPLMTDNAATLLDFHIIYSPVYLVPVLLIQGRRTGKAHWHHCLVIVGSNPCGCQQLDSSLSNRAKCCHWPGCWVLGTRVLYLYSAFMLQPE